MDRAEPKTLTATLTMTAELAQELTRETGALEVARTYEVTDAGMAQAANDELRQVKARALRLRELKAGFVAPAKQIIANAEALFDPALEALGAAEKFLKDELVRFGEVETRRIEDARRARDAEERKLRQEAEQKAAAERAKAEALAKQEREKAEAAERAQRQAEAEGNKRVAQKAAAEAAAAQERARQAQENGERKAQQMELAGAAAASAVVVPEATRVDGFSTRENWVAELEPDKDEDGVKYEICCAIAGGRRDLAALLKLDMAAANRLAKAQKRAMSAPGLRPVNRPIAASRA